MFLSSFSELSSRRLASLSRSHGPWTGGREPLDLHLCLGMRCLVSAEEYLAPPNGWRPQLAPEADICAWCTCGLFLLGSLKAWGPLPEDFLLLSLHSCWRRPLSLFAIPAALAPAINPAGSSQPPSSRLWQGCGFTSEHSCHETTGEAQVHKLTFFSTWTAHSKLWTASV